MIFILSNQNAFANYSPSVGYCQGMNFVVGEIQEDAIYEQIRRLQGFCCLFPISGSSNHFQQWRFYLKLMESRGYSERIFHFYLNTSKVSSLFSRHVPVQFMMLLLRPPSLNYGNISMKKECSHLFICTNGKAGVNNAVIPIF